MTSGASCLQITDDDIRMILAAGAHKWPHRNFGHLMKQYIYDGSVNDAYIIMDIRKMWEKLMLAARAIASIENPNDICIVGSVPEVQRAILKFAHYTGSVPIAGRFTPGSFTNQITKAFKEPRLIVVSNPLDDQQAIKEAAYVNIPVIAFTNPTSNISCVDIGIPCNNSTCEASGLMWWFLCREVLRLKGSISRVTEWNVMVDLFIHREIDAREKQMQKPAVAQIEPEAIPTTAMDDITLGMQVPAGFIDPLQTDEFWNEGLTTGTIPSTTWTSMNPTGEWTSNPLDCSEQNDEQKLENYRINKTDMDCSKSLAFPLRF
ncbi:hypothetical protein GJ496_005954 [Pomphorhynchus laevis]|nr:hypothetical protein GJ496_005954 [Pomphorhynchus laevis]